MLQCYHTLLRHEHRKLNPMRSYLRVPFVESRSLPSHSTHNEHMRRLASPKWQHNEFIFMTISHWKMWFHPKVLRWCLIGQTIAWKNYDVKFLHPLLSILAFLKGALWTTYGWNSSGWFILVSIFVSSLLFKFYLISLCAHGNGRVVDFTWHDNQKKSLHFYSI